MKVENSKNPFYIGYLLELLVEIWRFFILFLSKSGELGPFFSQNPLYV